MLLRLSEQISIHTPHAGSDTGTLESGEVPEGISIHTPHAGSDFARGDSYDKLVRFQSTLPMRGVTLMDGLLMWRQVFQSTLPMRGVTGLEDRVWRHCKNFNPHSPCGE